MAVFQKGQLATRYLIEGKETTDTENKTLYVLKTEGVWIIDFIPTT